MRTVTAAVGAAVGPGDVWGAWNLDPLAIGGIALLVGLYARGVRRLRAHGGRARVPRWRVACFAGAVAALTLALVSPVDRLGGTLLLVHMIQHLLLVLVAAPLLVLAAPARAVAWALREDRRRSLDRWRLPTTLSRPGTRGVVVFAAWAVHLGVLWAWHMPALYQAALRYPLVHVAEHATMLGSALVFWWAVLRLTRRWGYGQAVGYVFLSAFLNGGLASLLTFASRPWYPWYEPGAELWGLTALGDQQIAGALMWVGGGAIYVTGGALLFAAWLRAVDRRTTAVQAAVTPRAGPPGCPTSPPGSRPPARAARRPAG